MAVAALVLGIISLVIAIGGSAAGMGWVGSICGILAIIFGAVSNKTQKTGMGTAGIVLGILSLCWGIILTIACVACAGAAIGFLSL